MKNKIVVSIITAFGLFSMPLTTEACTRVVWHTQEHGTFVTRTMDWSEQSFPDLVNYPAGIKYTTHVEVENLVKSKYPVTGLTIYGMLADAVNSQGLSGNLLYNADMEAKELGELKNSVGATTYLRYMLAQYKTVADVVKATEDLVVTKEMISTVPVKISVHFSFQDPTGDSVIIQWRDGKPMIWHGKQYTILTNQPNYEKHLENLERSKRGWEKQTTGYTNLNTGGNTNPEDRFIHASYFFSKLKEPTSIINGVVKLNSVTFKIPQDAPNHIVNGKMAGYATEYVITRHLDSGTTFVRYQWGDTFSQVKYNEKEIMASGKKIKFPIARTNLYGDITNQVISSSK